jgi:hypothetical protein
VLAQQHNLPAFYRERSVPTNGHPQVLTRFQSAHDPGFLVAEDRVPGLHFLHR